MLRVTHMRRMMVYSIIALFLATSFSFAQTAPKPVDKNIIRLNILQINDVYELAPISGYGGLARVAGLKKQLRAQNGNTLLMIAGDFFSPSALGTAKVDNERLMGKQIVATFNTIGLDYATFGNHEFDISEEQFNARMSESKFNWVSSNVTNQNLQPFPKVPTSQIIRIQNQYGRVMKVGLFGVTIDSNKKPYVAYQDYMEKAQEQVAILRPQVDVLVALTHLDLADDIRLAETLPQIDLIMGGHEHENILVRRGSDLTPIAKADANARSAYIHRISYNRATKKLSLSHELKILDSTIPSDPTTEREVNKWIEAGFAGFRAEGFEPQRTVVTTNESLDGREVSVRNYPGTMGTRIADAMRAVVPNADCALLNGGSIRIDDVVNPGPLVEYDIIRILPFGGQILSNTIKGSLLKKVLLQGLANKGKGGFLHHSGITRDGENWLINGSPLEETKTYTVAMSDFLVSGRETGLDYLKEGNPELKIGAKHGDIRLALISELKRVYGQN
ncbi:MAG TPA: bifunctional metallophosphatase/5'-nucleotidase [Rhodothermales bacterium]|nr:bifunctional metallophosphatase/5'-nucleotidase [Rhodothermales bacterium]